MKHKPDSNLESDNEIFDKMETNFIVKYFDGHCEPYWEFKKEMDNYD